MFGIEIRWNCNDYLVVSSNGVERLGDVILAEWPHGAAWGPRRALARFCRDEKRRQLVAGRLGPDAGMIAKAERRAACRLIREGVEAGAKPDQAGIVAAVRFPGVAIGFLRQHVSSTYAGAVA